MNKIISLILGIALGIAYEWSSIFVAWALTFIFLPSNVDSGIIIIFFPTVLCFITARYFVKKKMGYIPVIGLCVGVVIGFILLSIAMAGV